MYTHHVIKDLDGVRQFAAEARSLGCGLGVAVIAQVVETAEQGELLAAAATEGFQGYSSSARRLYRLRLLAPSRDC